MRAALVLPTPRAPVNRNAWWTRFCGDGVRERPRDVLLADQLREALRPVLARQDQIRHPDAIYFEPQRRPTPFSRLDGGAPRTSREPCRAVRRCLASLIGTMRLDKLTIKAQEALQAAHELAASRAHQELTPEHLLAALLDQQTASRARSCASSASTRRWSGSRWPRRWTRSRRCSGAAADIYVGRRLKDLIEEATQQSKEFKDEYISSEHLLLALAAKDFGAASRALKDAGVRKDAL